MSKWERLRAERERLGFSQDSLSTAMGHSRKSQTMYEAGKRAPDWDYLDSFAGLGADVLFILTGERRSSVPMPDANQLPQRLRERLTAAISSVEAGLDAVGRIAPPKIKAELVMAAYDILSRDGEAATAQIIRLVKA